MVNLNRLRGRIVEKGVTNEMVAAAAGIDLSTFYRKMNSNGEKFTIKEANAIVAFLDLSAEEATAIFFVAQSHKRESQTINE